MANQVANWADSHFFNTNHGSYRNINITYQLTPQAFWYGSGNASVVNPTAVKSNWILPYNLPYMFNNYGGYSVRKVGTY
ncbi:hypothetical protein XA3_04750 [Xylocopilactobacillus apicola]|uniref:Uncharacterized protein n=1 Tax=Xylocopilactobacillus apicola TaxID=2932184 RepID=A0AAU9CVM5_9LACO|nr:hypothetical protein XA3_04750 [Xylocopilactobacillus apicola]